MEGNVQTFAMAIASQWNQGEGIFKRWDQLTIS
jgi:predicted lipoprotein